MTADKYCYYLRNPSQIVEVPFEELYNLVLQYPYCQSLRFLLLKKAQQEKRVDYENLLETTATYSIDRKYLYRLLNQEKNGLLQVEDYILTPDFLELKDISTEELVEEKVMIGSDLSDNESAVDAGASDLGNISFNLDNSIDDLEVKEEPVRVVAHLDETIEMEEDQPITDNEEAPETIEANLAPSEIEEEEIIETEEVNQLFEEDSKEEEFIEDTTAAEKANDLIVEPSEIKPENDDLLSLLAKYSKENKVVKRIRRSKMKVKLFDQEDPQKDDEPMGELSSDDIDYREETIVQEESKQPPAPLVTEAILPEEDEILEIETLVENPISPEEQLGALDSSTANEKTIMEEGNNNPKTPKSSKPITSFEEVLEQMLQEDIKLEPSPSPKKTKKKKNRKKKKKKEKIFKFSKLKIDRKTELEVEDIVTPEEEKIFGELKASIEDLKKKKSGKATKKVAKKKKKVSKKKEDPKKQKAKKKKRKKKGKKDDEVVIRLARKSIKKNDDAVSETLARLLAEQGHKDMAILMYERLGLIFPKKSTFFAAEIKKLKNNKK